MICSPRSGLTMRVRITVCAVVALTGIAVEGQTCCADEWIEAGAGRRPQVAASTSSGLEGAEDTDGDALKDDWERRYFGNLRDQAGPDDPDDDGVTNAAEMKAGTDPTDPNN